MHMGPAMWVVSETSFYNTGTPYEKWLVSVLPHFQSCSQLMIWEKQKMAQMCGPMPCRRPK